MRLGRGTELGGELLQKLSLPIRELRRHFDCHLYAQIPTAKARATRDSFALHPKHGPWLCSTGHAQLAFAIEGRNVDLAPQCGVSKCDWNRAKDVVAFAAKEPMRSDLDDDFEIAGSSVGTRSVAGAAHKSRCARLDARRNRYRYRVLRLDQSARSAKRARFADGPSRSSATRARALHCDRKEPLLETHAPAAIARFARFGFRPPRGTAARAVCAGNHTLVTERLFAAEYGFFKRDRKASLDVSLSRTAPGTPD